MKKILVAAVLCFAVQFLNFSDVSANVVRITDAGAENLHKVIRNYVDNFNKNSEFDIYMSDIRLYDVSKINGVSTWQYEYGSRNNGGEFGKVIFFVDSQGYVHSIKFFGSTPEIAGAYLGIILTAIGVSPDEINNLHSSKQIYTGFPDKSYRYDCYVSSKNMFLTVLSSHRNYGYEFIFIGNDTYR